jgi:hypothetical protein
VQKGPYVNLLVQNVSPHSITKGVGAFAHPSIELGTFIDIRAGNGKDFDTGDALATQWFTFMDSQDAAASIRLGNTASGIFVNRVKSGMSFAEVESALGVPQTRVDLGEMQCDVVCENVVLGDAGAFHVEQPDHDPCLIVYRVDEISRP